MAILLFLLIAFTGGNSGDFSFEGKRIIVDDGQMRRNIIVDDGQMRRRIIVDDGQM